MKWKLVALAILCTALGSVSLAQTAVIARPTVTLNGWGPNGHVGAYEEGVNQGHNWGFDSSTTAPYINAGNAADTSSTTYAYSAKQHTHTYSGCIYTFPAVAPSGLARTLNIDSQVPPSGTDGFIVTNRSAGVWYSINGGTSWTQVYDSSNRSRQVDSITLSATQDLSKVQVMLFSDAHDDMYHKVFDINISQPTTTSGFLNPKFLIVGVMYAPPGAQSSATYGSNTVVGNSTGTDNSFSTQTTKSISIGTSAGIFGFMDSKTTTETNSFTQAQDTSSTVAVSQTTSDSTSISGFSDPNKGVNHDYDYIFLWLNPIVQFTVSNSTNAVVWNGYGYDLHDTPAYPDMHVVGIQMGCLNGSFYQLYQSNPTLYPNWATCQDILNNEYSRTWALNNADGSGPALTPTLANSSAPYNFCQQQGTDLYNVCHADPFSNSSYALTFSGGSPTSTDGRFTACQNSGCSTTINYTPGIVRSYSQGYSTTTTQSQSATYSFDNTYSVESQFQTSGWLATLSAKLTNSTKLSWSTKFSTSTNNSQGQTSSFTIVGPPAGYPGPTTFVVYQDNLYGTFMFYPGS